MKIAAVLMGAMATAAFADTVLERMADSYVRRGAKRTSFGYSEATLYAGIEGAIDFSKNTTLAKWYENQITGVVSKTGDIVNWKPTYYSLDDYRIGNNILWWYQRTKDEKYKKAADIIRSQLNRHVRNRAGGYWHRQPNYPNQMWLDGIFMADSFYSRWTSVFDKQNTTAWNDIVLQYDLIESHTRESDTGLLVHGYDESKKAVWADPVTGGAPLVWSRAVGWYFMSLAETLEVFPTSHPGYARLLRYFTSLAKALKDTQDTAGGWWLIMTEPYPGERRNYLESSASAMFTFGFLRGIRLGYLSEQDYLPTAQRGYEALVGRWVTENTKDGTLNWEGTVEVGSLSSNGSYEYYVSVPVVRNDKRGGGSFLLAAYDHLGEAIDVIDEEVVSACSNYDDQRAATSFLKAYCSGRGFSSIANAIPATTTEQSTSQPVSSLPQITASEAKDRNIPSDSEFSSAERNAQVTVFAPQSTSDPPTPETTDGNGAQQTSEADRDKRLDVGELVGIIVAVLGLIIAAITLWVTWKMGKLRNPFRQNPSSSEGSPEDKVVSVKMKRRLQQEHRIEV
ncbi:rhamnogalacturonyl hydrolase [Paramyrothecium foliicola]|nr:rhamnogalacturonyl hydrolase [Paramyrothecium foliicola]